MEFKRACLVEPHRFEIFTVDESPAENEVLVQIASCGLCNWEVGFWIGKLNFQGYPHKLGHEWSGKVVAVGSGCKRLKVGDNVSGFARGFGGFAEYKVIAESACEILSDGIDPVYALGEPQKCIITVLRAAQPEAGDVGIIVGCGPMGLWCIQALKGNLLSALVAIDVDDEKLKLAKKFGAAHTINSAKENAIQRIAEITGGRLADFVIEGTGIPSVLNECQNYLKSSGRGRLLMMSSHKEPCPNFNFEIAMDKSIEILVPHPNYSHNELDDFRRAVALINNGTFQTKELVSHTFKLSEINMAFETLEHKPQNFLKGIVIPD